MEDRDEAVRKLESIASPAPSDWRDAAEWRVKNREWLRLSGSISIRIFMDKGGCDAMAHVMETLGCDEAKAHEILRGDVDLKLSEAVALVGFDGFCEAVHGLYEYVKRKGDSDGH